MKRFWCIKPRFGIGNLEDFEHQGIFTNFNLRGVNMKVNPWAPGTPVEENSYNWKDEPVIERAKCHEEVGEFTLVDLFSGCGGFSCGFSMAGFSPLLAIDIHKPSLETYRINHPHTDVIRGDIRKVSEDMILEVLNGRRVDVVTAGVPCQGFSRNNRKRSDQDERNYLFLEFIRIVQILQPKVVLLENVSGLKSASNGAFASAIISAIEKSGYRVKPPVILSAAEYGVPQKRERIFFMGLSEGIEVHWPRPTHGPRGAFDYVTVWEAIGDLPQIGPGESATEYDQAPFCEYQRLMRDGSKEVQNHIAPKHPPATIERIASTKPGEPMYPRFKQRIRLHRDELSPTQVSGGIRPQFQLGHPEIPRGLTVRERCRIQSFPDWYHISGGVVQGRYQTGNAVPPLLAKAIAEQIAKGLRGEVDEPRSTKRFFSTGNPQLVLFEPQDVRVA